MLYTLSMVGIINKKRQLMDDIIKPMGLTRVEWQLLGYLSASNCELTQKQLIILIDNDPAFIARALDKLTIKKLIRRKINPDDKRQRYVLLTAKGKPIAKKLYEHSKEINAKLVRGLSKGEINMLEKLISKVEDNAKML